MKAAENVGHGRTAPGRSVLAQRLFLATPILLLGYGVADIITLTSLLYFFSNVFASFIVPERIA
jgi:hypothetical protein